MHVRTRILASMQHMQGSKMSELQASNSNGCKLHETSNKINLN
jgi:hypothetical protein